MCTCQYRERGMAGLEAGQAAHEWATASPADLLLLQRELQQIKLPGKLQGLSAARWGCWEPADPQSLAAVLDNLQGGNTSTIAMVIANRHIT